VLKIYIKDLDKNDYHNILIPLNQVHTWEDVKSVLTNKEIQPGLFIRRVVNVADSALHEADNNEVIPPDAGNKFILASCYLYSIK
jgi:hypothetical protein